MFDTPVGPHDWLTPTVILGRGARKPDPDHTVFDYFAVTGDSALARRISKQRRKEHDHEA